MPFDPTKPTEGEPLDAAVIRAQLVALKPHDLNTAVSNALAGTAQNPNVSSLGISINDPPTQNERQQILAQFDKLVNQLHR